MSRNLLSRIANLLQRIENSIFGHGHPPDAFCLAAVHQNPFSLDGPLKRNPFSLKDLIGNGLLWAVPKHRRSIEKRLKRKYGHDKYGLKILLPKTHLRVCIQCGHDYEVGILCPNCYKKVKIETEQMQEKIQEELGIDPIDKEVVVLYEGEKNQQSSEFFNGKRIVEMDKPRPMWFSKNLLQKSTREPAETKEVKPTDLA